MPSPFLKEKARERLQAIRKRIGQANFFISPLLRGLKSYHFLPALSAVQLTLFALLARLVDKHAAFPIDIVLSRSLQKLKSPVWRYTTKAIGYLGEAALLSFLVVPVAFIFWRIRWRLEAVMTVGFYYTCLLIRTAFRHIVNRRRPNPLLVRVMQKPHGKSFPSGHVVASTTFWGWLAALGMMHMKDKPRWQKALLGIPLTIILLVGPTRIYLGDHWTSDVIGGYLLGGGWLSMTVRVYLALKKKGVLSEARL